MAIGGVLLLRFSLFQEGLGVWLNGMIEDWAYPALFVVASLAGLIDAVAGGGGLLTLPALLSTGLPPQVVLGTNKLQASCGTSLAAWRFWQAGLMKQPGLWLGVAISFMASATGSFVATLIAPDFLRRLVPVLLIGVAGYLVLAPKVGESARAPRVSPWLFAGFFGIALGFYDGFFGPGTGSFWMTASMALLGLEIRSANAYTKAMNLSSNLASLSFFALQGKVQFPIALTMATGQLLGAQIGSRLAIRRGGEFIRPVLFVVVLVLAIRLLWQTFHT